MELLRTRTFDFEHESYQKAYFISYEYNGVTSPWSCHIHLVQLCSNLTQQICGVGATAGPNWSWRNVKKANHCMQSIKQVVTNFARSIVQILFECKFMVGQLSHFSSLSGKNHVGDYSVMRQLFSNNCVGFSVMNFKNKLKIKMRIHFLIRIEPQKLIRVDQLIQNNKSDHHADRATKNRIVILFARTFN